MEWFNFNVLPLTPYPLPLTFLLIYGFGITCPVCFEGLSEEVGCVLAYHCGHPLCNECYEDWRNHKGAVCPVCRALDVVKRGRGRPRSSA